MQGQVVLLNKLITVKPLKKKYFGEIGDVVVGRVEEISNKKWKVNIGSSEPATLHINAVKLEDAQVY